MTTEQDQTTNNTPTPTSESENQNVTTSFKVKKKNKVHPSQGKYPGYECYEVNEKYFEILGELTEPDELKKFITGRYIWDAEKTAEYFDSLQVGDVFGCPVFMHDSESEQTKIVLSIYKIESIGADVLHCQDVSRSPVWNKKKVDVFFEDVSNGLKMELTEILYRDDKPYGIPEEEEINVKVILPPGTKLKEPKVEEEKENK
jgi:hypothetical protein